MQNFMQIPPRRAYRQMGEIYAKNFLYTGWSKKNGTKFTAPSQSHTVFSNMF